MHGLPIIIAIACCWLVAENAPGTARLSRVPALDAIASEAAGHCADGFVGGLASAERVGPSLDRRTGAGVRPQQPGREAAARLHGGQCPSGRWLRLHP